MKVYTLSYKQDDRVISVYTNLKKLIKDLVYSNGDYLIYDGKPINKEKTQKK